MFLPVILLIACAAGVVHGDLALSPEEMAAIQERQDRHEMLEKMRSIFSPEEMREENCIKEKGECKFGSKTNCCGIATRCIVFDTQIPQRNGPAKWISRCRRYKLGQVMEDIQGLFQSPEGEPPK